MIIRIALYGLIALGLWSGGRLSYSQFQSGDACPILGVIPACYVALAGYVLMALALVMTAIKPGLPTDKVFWTGLLIAGGLALLGSIFEVVKGDVCPKALGWLPMCYLSFAFSVLIGFLYSMTATAVDNQ